jgi:hypothetical protein
MMVSPTVLLRSATLVFLLPFMLGQARGQGLTNLQRLGFFDSNYTRSDSFQNSILGGMNEAG